MNKIKTTPLYSLVIVFFVCCESEIQKRKFDENQLSISQPTSEINQENLFSIDIRDWPIPEGAHYGLTMDFDTLRSIVYNYDSTLSTVIITNNLPYSRALLIHLRKEVPVGYQWVTKGTELRLQYYSEVEGQTDVLSFNVLDTKGSGVFFERLVIARTGRDSIVQLGSIPLESYVVGWGDTSFTFKATEYQDRDQNSPFLYSLDFEITASGAKFKATDTLHLRIDGTKLSMQFLNDILTEEDLKAFCVDGDLTLSKYFDR